MAQHTPPRNGVHGLLDGVPLDGSPLNGAPLDLADNGHKIPHSPPERTGEPGCAGEPEGVDEPERDCPLCPRLVAFRKTWRGREPQWHNAPVPSFGAQSARLLIVGLAPGLRGANATGRPFTGDYAGDLLYETLIDYGFASGVYAEHPADGLRLHDCKITNAVRCVPPENKPLPAEITACRPFFSETLRQMPHLRVVLVLGRVAHETTLRAFGVPLAKAPFVHGGVHRVAGVHLVSSYHCSRYNTNTKRLTTAMFRQVFEQIRVILPV